MPPRSSTLHPVLSLLIVLITSGALLSEATSQSETVLNRNLCKNVGADSDITFQKEDIDYCKCHLDKEVLICQAYRKEYSSENPDLVGSFKANLSLGSAKLRSFLYLFASTESCSIGRDDVTRVSCCLFSLHDEPRIEPSLQLGFVTSLAQEVSKEFSASPEPSEFKRTMTTYFPEEGTASLPSHCYRDFSIKIVAPAVFKGIRQVLDIDDREFVLSIGNRDNQLKNLGKLGGSGNGFYLTHDDKYFIKSTKHDEYENFLKILPNYFRYIKENPSSLISRFSGSFEYKSSHVHAAYFITNNLFPSNLVNPEKFDLKGSIINRKTSEKEQRTKKTVTLKDINFMAIYPDGFFVEPELYDRLMQVLHSDVEFLLSQNCLDYSFLIGVVDATQETIDGLNKENLNVIPVQTKQGKNKILYMGIIDILQPFSNMKRIESSLKSMIHDKTTITIVKPTAYADRFVKFISEQIFKRMQT